MIDTRITSTNLYLGTCKPCDRPYRIDLGTQAARQYQQVTCPGCGSAMNAERLAAVTTEESCDPRCMGATGPSCQCACGGENHGAAWGAMATTLELESAVAALRARQARLAKQRVARQEQKEARQANLFAEWTAEGNQDVVDYLLNGSDFGNFLFDMFEIVSQQKPLTPNQASAVRRIAEQEAKRTAKQAAYEATKKAAPLGKGITIEGLIISVKSQDGYAYGTVDWKMTVQCGGYRVWGTVPSALIGNIITVGCYDALRGQRVRFVANVVPSKSGDASFAIYKNPKQAEKL